MNAERHGSVLIVALIGGVALFHALSLPLGTLNQMGPGMFPFILGIILLIIAVALYYFPDNDGTQVAQEPASRAERGRKLRSFVLVSLSVISFVIVGELFGMAPAVFVTIFFASVSHHENGVMTSMLLASALMVVCVVLFHSVLGISIPILTVPW